MVDGDRDELGLRIGGSYRLDPATGELTRIPPPPEEAAPSPSSISPASPSPPSPTAPKLPPIR